MNLMDDEQWAFLLNSSLSLHLKKFSSFLFAGLFNTTISVVNQSNDIKYSLN